MRVDHGDSYVEETDNAKVLLIQRCSVCEQPTLSTYQWIDGWSDPSDEIDFTRVYPEQRALADLPARVQGRYSAMLEMAHAPDMFAVRAGSLLEAVCNDRGITKGKLETRLDALVSGGTVPQALADQAHLVRRYRNIGGHDDDAKVEDADVPLIRGFVEALLDFLYWGPAKLARGTAALEARRRQA